MLDASQEGCRKGAPTRQFSRLDLACGEAVSKRAGGGELVSVVQTSAAGQAVDVRVPAHGNVELRRGRKNCHEGQHARRAISSTQGARDAPFFVSSSYAIGLTSISATAIGCT